jgi:hypothetical protein
MGAVKARLADSFAALQCSIIASVRIFTLALCVEADRGGAKTGW